MEYTIILTPQEEGGFTAQCLELPGAITEGETKEEALKNAKDAIELVLEGMREDLEKEKHEFVKVRLVA